MNPGVIEDLAQGLALLERGSRTLDRQVIARCRQLPDRDRFDDGIDELESPDGEWADRTHWYHTRDDEDAIAPWW